MSKIRFIRSLANRIFQLRRVRARLHRDGPMGLQPPPELLLRGRDVVVLLPLRRRSDGGVAELVGLRGDLPHRVVRASRRVARRHRIPEQQEVSEVR